MLDLRANALLALVYWDGTSVERFRFKYGQSKFTFIPATLGVACKYANETEVTESGRDEILPIYREKFTDRGMFRDSA